jgi:S-adenosylmethionine hydrolase
MPKPIITLLTDFGTRDYFVAAMKGVVLNICPDAMLVDITHEIAPFSIPEAAFTLTQASRYFPKGTIHIVVVDPGVGGARRPLLVQTGGQLFVGPDNGVLSLILQDGTPSETRVLSNPEFFLPEVSRTFHGRDVFAPVAAHLARGASPDRFGPVLTGPSPVGFDRPVQTAPNRWEGSIIKIDNFGNIVTNFDYEHFSWVTSAPFECEIAQQIISTYAPTYCESADSQPVALFGSAGFLELSLNRNSLAASWKAGVKEPVELRRQDTADG